MLHFNKKPFNVKAAFFFGMETPKFYCIFPKEITSWRRVCSKKQGFSSIQVKKLTMPWHV